MAVPAALTGDWPARVARGWPLSLPCGHRSAGAFMHRRPRAPWPHDPLRGGDPVGRSFAPHHAALPSGRPPGRLARSEVASSPPPSRSPAGTSAALRLTGAQLPTIHQNPDCKLQGQLLGGRGKGAGTEASREEEDKEAIIMQPRVKPRPRGTRLCGSASRLGDRALPGIGRPRRRSRVRRLQLGSGRSPAVAALAPGLRFCKPAESIGLPGPVGSDNLAFKFGGSGVRGAEGGARRAAHAQNGLPVPRGLCSRGERRSARRVSDLERVLLLTGKTERRTRTLSPNLLLTRKAALPSKRGYFLRCPAPSHPALETLIILIIIKQVRQPEITLVTGFVFPNCWPLLEYLPWFLGRLDGRFSLQHSMFDAFPSYRGPKLSKSPWVLADMGQTWRTSNLPEP